MAPLQLTVLEGQLTWLVYIIGALLKGRLSTAGSEAHETLDGDLAARVLQLIPVMDEGLLAQRWVHTHTDTHRHIHRFTT